MKLKLSQLVAQLQPSMVWGDLNQEIRGIAYDSRRVKPGDLFVCVPGLVTDGHRFLPQALRGGAGALIISKRESRPLDFSGPVVLVEDSRRALSSVADVFYGQPSRQLKLIGITGTNGKSTTAYLVAAILRAAGKRVGLLSTVEYQIGNTLLIPSHTTPESLDLQNLLARMLKAGSEYVVMEVSSHALALERVRDCYFAAAVFTNLSPEHLDFHHEMETYFTAKEKLFLQLDEQGMAVTNLDDAWGERIVSNCKGPVVTYSRLQDADIRLRDFEAGSSGLSVELQVKGKRRQLHSPLLGDYNLGNLLAAAGTAVSQGIDWPAIAQGVAGLAGVPGRFEPVDCGQDFTVVVDFAHTDDALRKLLQAARRLTRGRLITVFGCGGNRDKGKRQRMGTAAHELSDYVIITSDNPRSEDPVQIIKEIERGLLKAGGTEADYRICPERRQAIEEAIGLAQTGDMVVIAGKGHEDYQIVGNERLPFDDRKVVRETILRKQ